jgi:hypothetical protein
VLIKNIFTTNCFLLVLPINLLKRQVFSSFGQAQPTRVSFTIANPSLKNREIDIRYFDNTRYAPSGYGYDLTALGRLNNRGLKSWHEPMTWTWSRSGYRDGMRI